MLLAIKNLMNNTGYQHIVIDVGQIEKDNAGMKDACVL
jgi:hypothetical protein